MPAHRRPQAVFAGGPRRPDGGEDAAARVVQLLVARASGPERELVDPVAGEAGMRVAVDEAGQRAQAAAVELLDVAVEWLEIAHRADRRHEATLGQEVRVFDDLDFPERATAQRRLPPGRGHELREVSNEEPLRPVRAAHSEPGRGIGTSSPCSEAVRVASS